MVGGQKTFVEVTTDEAVGVALSLGQQVYVDRDIWEGARVSFTLFRFFVCHLLFVLWCGVVVVVVKQGANDKPRGIVQNFAK